MEATLWRTTVLVESGQRDSLEDAYLDEFDP